MTTELRWGILGAAKFAREHMGPAIHQTPNNRIAALATSNVEKAEPFLAMDGRIKVFSDYDALIQSDSVDAVYIPLPNHLHIEWARKAAQAGKHVLCEKPIAMEAHEIDDLIAVREQQKVLIAEAFMIVHHPQWQYARDLFQSGAIGKLVQVDGVFSYDNRADTANIRNRAETGGGGLRDIGVYTFGSTRYVTGEEPIHILSTHIDYVNDVDTWANVTAQFPSFHFNGTTSMAMLPRQEMNFHGENGIIRLTAPFNPTVFGQAEVHFIQGNGIQTTKRFPQDNHYVHQVNAFYNSVVNGDAYACPLEFSKGTQRMIDMAFAH